MAALTAALIGLTALQGGLQYSASMKQAKAVRRQGWAEADLLGQNAKLAEQQAQDAVARGTEQANRLRQNVEGLVGDQRVALAAQGIALGSGSAADIVDQSFTLGEADAAQIEANAAREAWGYGVQASQYRAQAGFTMKAARNQAKALRMTGYETLLTTGTSLAMLGSGLRTGRRAPYSPPGRSGGYSGGSFG